MRTKHWLPLFSSLVAVSVIAACGSDDSAPKGTAGFNGGGAAGAHAGASNGGSGGAHAGAANGGAATNAGAANGGASASAGAGDSGSAGMVSVAGGGSGGDVASSGAGGAVAGAGAGGAAAGGGAGGAAAGGGAGGSSGGGGAAGINLCDRALWKYTFQFCPRTYNAGANQPTKAVDGVVTTYVTSGKSQDGTFFAVFDLHGAANVSSLVVDYGTGQVDNKEGDASTMPMALQGSDDGVTFTNITDAVTNTITNHKVTIDVPPGVTHRYLKLLQKGTSGSWWALPEVDITCTTNGTPAAPPADAVTTRANWKILTPNSACSDVNVGAMLDSNLDTQWQSVGVPGVGYWLRVDLGGPTLVNNVDFKIKAGADFPVTVKLQTSTDDITYVDVKTGVPGAIDTKIVLDAPVTTRFFRIVTEADTTGGAWWSIGELDVNVP